MFWHCVSTENLENFQYDLGNASLDFYTGFNRSQNSSNSSWLIDDPDEGHKPKCFGLTIKLFSILRVLWNFDLFELFPSSTLEVGEVEISALLQHWLHHPPVMAGSCSGPLL